MAQQYLTVNGGGTTSTNKKIFMIKTYSFTTDDEDAGSINNSQPVSNHNKLLSMNSPSIDSNTNDDDVPKTNNKLTKRKSQRQTETENHITNRRPSIKMSPSKKKFDLKNILWFIGMLVILYFMWINRDFLIQRYSTSNHRLRRASNGKNEQTIKHSTDSSTTTTTKSSKDSLSDSSDNDDSIEDTEEENDMENPDDDLSSSPTKSSSSQKIHIRIRRNKMSFNKEHQKKKFYPSQNSSDDVDNENNDEEEEEEKSIKKEQLVSPSSTQSTKKSRSTIENVDSDALVPIKSALSLSTYDDIIEQLRKNLKLRSRNSDFLSTLSKTSGLNKEKLYRFIYKKDYQSMTLQTFMSLLDSFNLMLLIVSK